MDLGLWSTLLPPSTVQVDPFKYIRDIRTPLILGGFVVSVAFLLFQQILKTRNAGKAQAEGQKRVSWFVFILSFLAIVLGFLGFVWPTPPAPPVTLFGRVYNADEPTDSIKGAKVFLELATTQTKETTETGEFIFAVANADVNKQAYIWALAPGRKTSGRLPILIVADSEKILIPLEKESPIIPGATVSDATEPIVINPASCARAFRTYKQQELPLARWGDASFEAGQFEWAQKFYLQAMDVEASGVWRSSYPLLAATYMLIAPKNTQRAESLLHDMIKHMSPGGGYLANRTTTGFVLNNFGLARKKLTDKDQDFLDVYSERVVTLRKQWYP